MFSTDSNMSITPILQKPYVLASLPRPIESSNGRYAVGNVYGGSTASKKRKRSELAVGIDGDGVNLYDVSSAKLITSYAMPPQMSFTCPPCSLRIRTSKSRVERKTYVSITGPQPQITLFHDVTEGSDETSSTTKTISLIQSPRPVIFAGTIKAAWSSDISHSNQDLIVVKEDGDIQCFDGDNLEARWNSPSTALKRATSTPTKTLRVEYVQITNALAARKGLLKYRQDLFGHLPQEISDGGFNPELMFIITLSKTETPLRTLHVVALPKIPSGSPTGLQRSVESLLAVPLPFHNAPADEPKSTFNLHAPSGELQELCDNFLTTFDIIDTFPKKSSEIYSSNANSFVRLSSTSVMISTSTSVSVYNPKYQSLMGTINVESAEAAQSSNRKRSANGVTGVGNASLELIAYFQKLGVVIAVKDHELIAIEIAGQNDHSGRERCAGLLIDSLRCSDKEERPRTSSKIQTTKIGLSTMDFLVSTSVHKAEKGLRNLQNAFLKGDTVEFEALMAESVGVDWTTEDANVADIDLGRSGTLSIAKQNESLSAGQRTLNDVDRRWILYLLSHIFSLSKGDDGESHLAITFYPSNAFMWLIRTRSMTKFNVESALRKYHGFSLSKTLQAGALVDAVIEFDPDMDLLLGLLASVPLDAAELLHAIRRLMESLELFGEKQDAVQGLRTDGQVATSADEDMEKEVERLEKEAEEDLQLAEYQLGPGSGVRGQALTLALSKLYTCPDSSIIFSLQTKFSSHEIVSLIYLLRFELARGAWTSRYLDSDQFSVIDEDTEIPDNAIVLISSLLNNCIDAVGAGGWLAGDARLLNKDPFEAEELITSLKLEVSAALEGIEEAVYLKGLTSEMIRYGDQTHNNISKPVKPEPELPAGKKRKVLKRPVVFASLGQDFKTLPLGMKAERRISKLRVGAGGEVQERSARDIGRLKSQKVGKYTLERIVI